MVGWGMAQRQNISYYSQRQNSKCTYALTNISKINDDRAENVSNKREHEVLYF